MQNNLNTDNFNFGRKELASPFLILIVTVVLIVFVLGGRKEDAPEDVVLSGDNISSNLFENLDLEASAAIVWDINKDKEVFSKNPETQLPLASLTKVMMALASLENSPKGMIVTIKEEYLLEEGDSGLLVGERWRLKDLINFSLTVSSNDGAKAIASAVGSQIKKDSSVNSFVDLMNKEAQEIGLAQTYFISPSGLDKRDVIPGGNGSARDMATLFEYVLKNKPEVFEFTAYPDTTFDSLDFSHEAENTNSELLKKLPGIVASKTGFTDLAGGNLFIIFEPEPTRPVVLGVLGSSIEGRFSDIEKLYKTTLTYLNR